MSERSRKIEEALGSFCPRCLRGDHSAHGTKVTPNGCLWCRCGHLADCGCGGCDALRVALALPVDEAPVAARDEGCERCLGVGVEDSGCEAGCRVPCPRCGGSGRGRGT